MPTLERIHEGLLAHDPDLVAPTDLPEFQAAVALVLHEPEGDASQLLLIERAERAGDPWSGHMALPGGRREPGDRDLQETAARETREEVGFDVGEPIGRLDDFSGGSRLSAGIPPLLVAPFVYRVDALPSITPNHEVNSTVWVPLRWILDPASWVRYEVERNGLSMSFPAIRYERYTIWGLTYRILFGFFSLLGREIPEASDQGR